MPAPPTRPSRSAAGREPSVRPRLSARRSLAVLAAGLALALVAFVFDASPLLVCALALVLLGALTPPWVLCAAWGLRARRRVAAERVVEGAPLETTIELRRGWLGAPGAELRDPSAPDGIPLSDSLSPLRGAARARVKVVARFPRRGLHRLAPATIVVRDPLDLARVELLVPGAAEPVLVLPRTERVQWAGLGAMRRVAQTDGDAGADALAAADLDGLRPYRPGTPASRIFWPGVARGAGLLERRLRAEGESRPLVVLDTRGAGPGAELAADAAVRAAASLVLELAREGGCGLLLPGEQRPAVVDRELIAWPAAHARLAVARSGPAAPAPRVTAGAGRSGSTIYVAAAPAERLATLRRLATAGPVVLVVPAPSLHDGRPPGHLGASRVLSVSGCEGFALGPGPVRRTGERRRGTASAA